MKVRVNGHGLVNFPEDMTKADIQNELKKLTPTNDNKELMQAIKQLLQLITVPTKTELKVVEVEKPIVTTETKVEVVEIEKRSPTKWHFQIERDDSGITEIWAEPYE